MKSAFAICLLGCLCLGSAIADETSAREIDHDVWSLIVRTVAEGDIKGMASAYHPDAVLVANGSTAPIAGQLVKWGQDMETQKRDGTRAAVSFRFTRRQDDTATAFDSGIFKYTVTAPSGDQTPSYIRFESLLTKKNGRWLILMERQLEVVDQAEWSALD